MPLHPFVLCHGWTQGLTLFPAVNGDRNSSLGAQSVCLWMPVLPPQQSDFWEPTPVLASRAAWVQAPLSQESGSGLAACHLTTAVTVINSHRICPVIVRVWMEGEQGRAALLSHAAEPCLIMELAPGTFPNPHPFQGGS